MSPLALTAGFQRAFLIGTGLVLAAALIAFMATNTRPGEHAARHEPDPQRDPERSRNGTHTPLPKLGRVAAPPTRFADPLRIALRNRARETDGYELPINT